MINFKSSNLKSNILSDGYIFIWRIVLQIFFAPLMIYFWGKENYSIWLFVFSLPTLISLLNITGVDAVRNKLAFLFKDNLYQEMNKYFVNTFIILLFLSSIFIFVYFFLIQIQIDQVSAYKNLINLIFFSTILNFLNSINYCKLTYAGKLKFWNTIEIIFDFLTNLTLIVLGIFTENILYGGYVYLFLKLVKILIYSLKKDKILKNILNFKLFSIFIIKDILRFSSGLSFENLSHIVKNSGLTFALGITTNFLNVGLINSAKTLFYFLLIRACTVINRSIVIKITQVQNKGTLDKKILSKFISFLIILLIFLLITYVVLFTFGSELYNFWLSNSFKISNKLINLILLDACMTIIGVYLLLPFKALNKYFFTSLFAFFVNLVSIIIILNLKNSNLENIYLIVVCASFIILIMKIIFYIYNKKKLLIKNERSIKKN